MRALLLLCAAIAQALQFTTQQAKTPALLDAATTLKASARPLTKVLLDAAEGASDEARAETMKTLRDMLCSASATQLVACRGAEDSTDVIATCAVAAREQRQPRPAPTSATCMWRSRRRAGVATRRGVPARPARARGLGARWSRRTTPARGASTARFPGRVARARWRSSGTTGVEQGILRLDIAN